MFEQAQAGAVLYAKNVATVQAFYQVVAGLAAEHVEDGYVVLQSGCFQLVILAIPARIAASIAIENPPARRSGTPVKLVFFVPDLAVARAAAASHGGELGPLAREWDFHGCRVCDGQDPEGNVVQFRQRSG